MSFSRTGRHPNFKGISTDRSSPFTENLGGHAPFLGGKGGREGKIKGEKGKGRERKRRSSKGRFSYSFGGSNRKETDI
jgi:hypothetical protein